MTRYSFLIASCVLLISSCSKVQEPELGNSALVFVGDQSIINIHQTLSTQDGGMILVYHSRENKHQDIKITKFDKNLNKLWERTMGGTYDDEVQNVFIDKDNNILISGFAYGYKKPREDLASLRNWAPYYHLLSNDGSTIWEKVHVRYVTNVADQKITDVVQDADNNYLFTGKFNTIPFAPDGSVFAPYTWPAIREISPNGELLNEFVLLRNRPNGIFETIFETGSSYTVFAHNIFSREGNTGEVIQIDQSKMEGVQPYQKLDSIISTNMADEMRPYVGKSTTVDLDNSLNLFYFYANNTYKYTYSFTDNKLSVKVPNIGLDNITWAQQIESNNYLFINRDKWVLETNSEFKEMVKFQSDYRLERICKLADQSYVGAVSLHNTIYLVHFNAEGKIQDHE
jgi:hypothetical protein